MREIQTHRVEEDGYSNRIVIKAIGERGAGGANMGYVIYSENPVGMENQGMNTCYLSFQNGDPKEQINGLSNESLLAVVLDRLKGFQKGEFNSPETETAITHIEKTLESMHQRTRDRIKRAVIGQLKK